MLGEIFEVLAVAIAILAAAVSFVVIMIFLSIIADAVVNLINSLRRRK